MSIILDQLSITNATGKIQSESVWGILRGLESFSQLLTVSADGLSVCNIFFFFFCISYYLNQNIRFLYS